MKVSNLAEKFYAPPLIERLDRQEKNLSRLAQVLAPLGCDGAGRPSYIPGSDFARAALDLLLRETGTPRPTKLAIAESPAEPGQKLQEELDQLKALQNLGLPVGWQRWPQGGEWIMKLISLLITAIAVSVGAPFWFELLNKLVNLRMAGRNPNEANARK